MGKVIKIINENGKQEQINVLKYLKLKSTMRKYLIYEDKPNGKVYCAEAISNNDTLYLNAVTDDIKKELSSIVGVTLENK